MDDSVHLADSSMPDAGLMDPMDDLFGESTDGLGVVALPPIPLPAAVVLRNAVAQRIGCCTKLAWSNTGSIAQISSDGTTISFRVMIRGRKSAKRSLSDASSDSLTCPNGRRFMHVAFNGVGLEMAATDGQGGVHLYTMAGALNRMQPAPGHNTPAESDGGDLDIIIGLHWLPVYPTEFRNPYITPGTKIDGRWVTQMRARDQNAPTVYHPIENRNALLHVRANGKLSLIYQNEIGVYSTITSDLDIFKSSEDLITHAAFGENGAHLLLTTHDEHRRIRLYKITINWNATQLTRGTAQYLTVTPTLEIGHLTALDKATPQISDVARLSHLRVIPVPAENAEPGASLSPVILGIYTHAASSLNALHAQPETISVLVRWHVESFTPTLHESFAKLKPNGSTSIKSTSTVLRRQADLISNKLILAVESQYWHTHILLLASDGTVDFRDRSTFTSIEPYADTTTVSSLPQSGFEYTQGEHHSQVAVSPDGSHLVGTRTDDRVEAQAMTLRYGWGPVEDGMPNSKGLLETAVVCLARQFSILSYSTPSNDDPLSLLPNDLSTELRTLFVKEIIRMTAGRPDLTMMENSKQQMMLFKDPFVCRAIGTQLVLGVKQNSSQRTFAGQFSYVLLNVRYISMALAQTVGSKMPDISRTDVPVSLIAPVNWATDLLVFVVDRIVSITRDKKEDETLRQAFEKSIADTGNPALHLLLCSVPRALLRSLIFYIPAFFRLVQASVPRATSVVQRQQLEAAFERAKRLPFTFKPFQDLLTEFDTSMRNAYNGASVTTDQRVEMELCMLTEGVIPNELEPAIEALCSTLIQNLLSHELTNAGELYYRNTEWLGIRNNNNKISQNLDVIRKVPMKMDAKRRICRRCGSQMEDVSHEDARQGPAWFFLAQRHCFCMNSWWIPS
ncbi:Hypothetical protein R9X50_00262900 [Acrodontium crateriforme]|uniref:Mediator of RNA polymerase II transcription subunit 16 n=1 Tax=Acrodontium crateriforme TaxID=150365 RepID=A0AAQ3R3M0_9PEZI|nr:Hypothetical protein R9X50_00262900 [Acrodontium crateriforme]